VRLTSPRHQLAITGSRYLTSGAIMDLSIFDPFVDAIADRVVAKLNTPKAPERIPVAEATAHGAPSARWVTARAREGKITIYGPRGGRHVLASELAILLGSTTIKRQARPVVASDGDLEVAAAEAAARILAKRGGS
jgi:hypothetical protein